MKEPPADFPKEEVGPPILLVGLSELSRIFPAVAPGRASDDEVRLMKEAGESTCLFSEKEGKNIN